MMLLVCYQALLSSLLLHMLLTTLLKPLLKTHVMFKSIQQVFERNTELLGSKSSSTKDKARSIITKIVNTLTASSEIGGPMAAMYLLKHPDHYTDYRFKTCLWRSYVSEVMKAWDDSAAIGEEQKTKVMLGMKSSGERQQVVALSPVIDYMWRPTEYEMYACTTGLDCTIRPKWPREKRTSSMIYQPP